MIELVVDGTPFTDFISADVTTSIESMAGDYSFTASSVNATPTFKKGDSIVASVDGEKKLTGFIDEVSGTDQEGNHTVTYSGRDKTGDFQDSQINIIDELRPSGALTLKRIIEAVISHLGSDLLVIDNVNPAAFDVAEDRINTEVGQSTLDFIMPLARKRQVLLPSDSDGNIVIAQSQPIDSGATLQRLLRSNTNNIISQSWTLDDKKEFNKYIHRGQLDPRALNSAGAASTTSVEDQGAIVTVSGPRVGRQRVIVEEGSYSSGQLKDRALWASQLAKARATRFSCVVQGHRNTAGALWEENTLVQINSEVADITRKMLINTITFSQGEGQATVTSLEFVEKDVYTIDARALAQKPAGDLNDAFKSVG